MQPGRLIPTLPVPAWPANPQPTTSTFFEEMSDAAHLMARATCRSLVILDELGRGTATHDGVAVASAVLHHLVHTTRCLTLFVTHYPELCEAASQWPQLVAACHMAYLREDGEGAGEGEGEGQGGEGEATGGEAGGGGGEAMEVDGGAGGSRSGRGAGGAARPARITFLYKLQRGAADESFGLNVAQVGVAAWMGLRMWRPTHTQVHCAGQRR